jgi:peptide/nickel transport system permease protein
VDGVTVDRWPTAELSNVRRMRVLGHAVPNAIGPTLQVAAFNVAYLAGGVILIEAVFNYPGLGGALFDSVRIVDVPVVQFIAMLLTGIWVVVNLLADLGTVLVTPRLRTTLR